MPIRDFTDLRVWQEAHALAVDLYKVTNSFPRTEVFGITSQIRRAASSVTANIAEGFGRHTPKDQEHFYVQSSGSLYELRDHLLLAKDVGYLSVSQFEDLTLKVTQTHQLLNGLLRAHRANRASIIKNQKSK